MPIPARLPLEIYAGDDFSTDLTFEEDDLPIDLTGATITAQWRKSKYSETSVSFVVTVTSAVGGEVTLSMGKVATATLNDGHWDIQAVLAGGSVRTLARGTVKVIKDITR